MKLSTDAVLLGVFTRTQGVNTFLDIGTGSGIVALMLAQRSQAVITALEPDPPSAMDARHNFTQSPWPNRLNLVESSVQDFVTAHPDRFDHIVSNPPFYNNSLPSPFTTRNLSKHTTSLPFDELLAAVKSLLEFEGAFSVIIPASEQEGFDRLASENGLFAHRKMLIYPKKSKDANRILTEYRTGAIKKTQIFNLTIRQENNRYTPEYKIFTGDFYLNF